MPTPNWFKRFIGIETEEDQRNNLTNAILHNAELRERLQSNYPREEPLVQEHPLMNAVLMISQPGTVLEKAIAPSVYRGMVRGLANGEGSNALLTGAGGFKTMKSFEELGSIRNALARSTTGEVHPTKSGKAAFTVTKEQEGPKRYVKTASTKPRKQYEAPKATVPGEGEFTAKEILSGDSNAYMNALISAQSAEQQGLPGLAEMFYNDARFLNPQKDAFKSRFIWGGLYKKGGKIHIKKSQRGSFTKYCNGKVTNECIQRGKNSPNPKIRKKAVFAQNARRWKHSQGGAIMPNWAYNTIHNAEE